MIRRMYRSRAAAGKPFGHLIRSLGAAGTAGVGNFFSVRRQRLLGIFCGVVFGISAAGAVSGETSDKTPGAGAGDRSTASEAPPASDGERSDSAPARLSQPSYAARQRATLDLWRHRDVSRPQVQQASENSDPEVAARAEWILRQWRRGALPETPPDVLRALRSGDDPSAILRLLEAGHFAAAGVAIDELSRTDRAATVRDRAAVAFERRFPMYVRSAIERDALSDLLRVVDLVANTVELAVCRLELMQHMERQVTPADMLPTAAKSWTDDQRLRATVLGLTILGRVDEAIEQARAGNDPELLRRCRMLAGRWQAIAEESASRARRAETGSLEETRQWAHTLAASDRCQAASHRREAVNHLLGEQAAGGTVALNLRWKSLAMHGQVEPALEILHPFRPDAAAIAAVAAARPEQAFDGLGFPREALGDQLGAWIDDALQAQAASETGELSEQTTRLLALMRCLLSVGDDKEAWTIAERLSRSPVKVGRIRLREYVLSTLAVTPRKDWVARLAVQPGETSISTAAQHSLVRTLTDADITTLKILLEALKKLTPDTSLRQRVEAAIALIQGELPDQFDRDTDFEGLYQQLLQEGSGEFERVGGRMVFQPRMKLNLNIARMFLRHGEVELGERCLEQLKMRDNMEASFALAQAELDAGRAEKARGMFQDILQHVDRRGRRLRGLAVGAGDVEIAVKSMIGLWTVAKRRGERKRADELEHQLRLMLCSPSTQLRSSIASYLAEQGEVEFAKGIYQVLLPVTGLGERGRFYDAAGDYAGWMVEQGEPAEAARWFDAAISESFAMNSFPSLAYVTLPRIAARWALEAAIQRGDQEGVERYLERVVELDPLDIDVAERLLPMMRDAGMKELADQTLDRMLDRGVRYLKTFSLDATMANNLAWVAAINQRRLDEGLKLAEQAVWLEPESTIYRDTLAEVLFRLGRREEALHIERACLLDDPDQWHLHEQIKRFETQ